MGLETIKTADHGFLHTAVWLQVKVRQCGLRLYIS